MVLENIWEAMVLSMSRLGGCAVSCGGTDLRKGFDCCGGLNEMSSGVSDIDLLVPSWQHCLGVLRNVALLAEVSHWSWTLGI